MPWRQRTRSRLAALVLSSPAEGRGEEGGGSAGWWAGGQKGGAPRANWAMTGPPAVKSQTGRCQNGHPPSPRFICADMLAGRMAK